MEELFYFNFYFIYFILIYFILFHLFIYLYIYLFILKTITNLSKEKLFILQIFRKAIEKQNNKCYSLKSSLYSDHYIGNVMAQITCKQYRTWFLYIFNAL